MAEIRRTVVVKLDVTDSDAALLHETIVETTQVDPAHTSQRCSKCGTTLAENRQSQRRFCCQKCGYEVNADYNAAKSIGFRLLRAGQKSPHGGATRHLALKSGTLNVNGSYSPADQ